MKGNVLFFQSALVRLPEPRWRLTTVWDTCSQNSHTYKIKMTFLLLEWVVCVFLCNCYLERCEVAQWITELSTKSDDQSSFPGTFMEEENQPS